MAIVDIGIAAFGSARPTWYTTLIGMLLHSQIHGVEIGRIHAVSSAVPDWNKNLQVVEAKARASKTDLNRSKFSKDFLSGKAEWLFQIDDDTTPPQDALIRLLRAGRDFIAGLYFNANKPHNPIAYIRRDDGLYDAFYGYPKGSLVQVDSVGMGCTLIHRSVFEKIYDEHKVFQRPDGSLFPLHNSQVLDDKKFDGKSTRPFISNGVLKTPVVEVPKDEVSFPFYAMEFGRTEDHHFCELAANVGAKPWVDTNIVCGHLKMRETTEDDYKKEAFEWLE